VLVIQSEGIYWGGGYERKSCPTGQASLYGLGWKNVLGFHAIHVKKATYARVGSRTGAFPNRVVWQNKGAAQLANVS
jgi:hypothetical protein